MLRRLIFSMLLCAPSLLWGQTKYLNYSWNTFPQEIRLDTFKSVNGALILLEREIKEIYLNKSEIFEELVVYHKKILVENTSAVNQYNKIYIPVDNVVEIVSIKARFTSPKGKISELSKGSIRKIENLENKGNYQTFAIEGAEVGGQIEYFYILRKSLDPYGSIYKQDNRPRLYVDIIYSYPDKLEYILKSYNGFADFRRGYDSVSSTVEQRAQAYYIPGIEEEKYTFYEAYLQRYEFTLAYNYFGSTARIYSWSKIADRFFDVYYSPSKKELSAVHDWLLKQSIDFNNQEVAIRTIDGTIKTTISESDNIDPEITLEKVISQKQGRKRDILRLYVAAFLDANIDFKLVCTSDRTIHPFDPDFNGWNFMDENLIYFPRSKKYIVPSDVTQRYGQVSPEFQESYALQFTPVSYGDKYKTLGYQVTYIPSVVSGEVTDSLVIKLTPDPTNLTLDASIHRMFNTEFASSFQAWWQLSDETRKKEMVKEIFGMGDPAIRIKTFSTQYNTPDDIGIHPMIWNVEESSDVLMQQAGDELIVKIGECIGQQSELYQTGPRKFPICISTLHSYYRRIEMKIPQGFKVDDIQTLNMDVSMMKNNKLSCFFRSTASIEGDRLVVISEERYSDSYYPVARFEEFRAVINAAADFNKRTVLLVKN